MDCVATPHWTSVTSVPVDPADHYLKLWVLAAKHYLRAAENAGREIERLARRVLVEPPEGGAATLMQAVLTRLAEVARAQRRDFVARCWPVCDDIATAETGRSPGP